MPPPGVAVRNAAEQTEAALLRRFAREMPFNVGHRDDPCKSCDALHWELERTIATRSQLTTSYSTCCQQGAVELPMRYFPNDPEKVIPAFYKSLLTENDECL